MKKKIILNKENNLKNDKLIPFSNIKICHKDTLSNLNLTNKLKINLDNMVNKNINQLNLVPLNKFMSK